MFKRTFIILGGSVFILSLISFSQESLAEVFHRASEEKPSDESHSAHSSSEDLAPSKKDEELLQKGWDAQRKLEAIRLYLTNNGDPRKGKADHKTLLDQYHKSFAELQQAMHDIENPDLKKVLQNLRDYESIHAQKVVVLFPLRRSSGFLKHEIWTKSNLFDQGNLSALNIPKIDIKNGAAVAELDQRKVRLVAPDDPVYQLVLRDGSKLSATRSLLRKFIQRDFDKVYRPRQSFEIIKRMERFEDQGEDWNHLMKTYPALREHYERHKRLNGRSISSESKPESK